MRLHLFYPQRFPADLLALPSSIPSHLPDLFAESGGLRRKGGGGGGSISPVFQVGSTFQNDAPGNHGGESHPGECDISNRSVCVLLI